VGSTDAQKVIPPVMPIKANRGPREGRREKEK